VKKLVPEDAREAITADGLRPARQAHHLKFAPARALSPRHPFEVRKTRAPHSIERFFKRHQRQTPTTFNQLRSACQPQWNQLLSNRMRFPAQPIWPNAFCVSPNCSPCRLTVAVVMKSRFADKQAAPSLRLRLCIGENHGNGKAVSDRPSIVTED
jgi:hypothetical protein